MWTRVICLIWLQFSCSLNCASAAKKDGDFSHPLKDMNDVINLASLINNPFPQDINIDEITEKTHFPNNNYKTIYKQLIKNNFLNNATNTNNNTSTKLPNIWDIIIKEIMKFVSNDVKPFYLPSNTGNEKCDLVLENFDLGSVWSLEMFDSWGKFHDGFLFGNVHLIGMYQECLDIEANIYYEENDTVSSLDFSGRHCTIYYKESSDDGSDNQALSLPDTRSGPAIATLLHPLPFYYASCIPSTCTQQDFKVHLNDFLKEHDRELLRLDCTAKHESREELDEWDLAVLSIICIIVFLVVEGTIIDVVLMNLHNGEKFRQGMFKYMMCFSWLQTLKKVFRLRMTEKSQDISCLHGLKAITLIWVIICHQYETGLDFLINTVDGPKYQEDLYAQIITNGWVSVNTFFVITGTLITYRLLPQILSTRSWRNKAYILCISIVRRIIRLSPSILMVAMFSATLERFLGMGPRQPLLSKWVMKDCRENWWKDPLFINNYIFGDHDNNTIPDCLDHCWYTAVDMQLYLVMPFIILPLVIMWIPGLVWLSLITATSIAVPLYITLQYDLPSSPLVSISVAKRYEYMWRVYMAPWCRAGPWIVGLWLGIVLSRKGAKTCRINKIIVIVGYLVAIGIGLALTLGLYDYNVVLDGDDQSTAASAIYGSLAWPAWGLGVAWVIFTCYTGNAGLVNYALSWPGWQPMSRLTFTTYLVSPVVQLWWSTVLYRPVYFNYLAKLIESCGVVFMSGLIALLLSTWLEIPISSVINIALPSAGPKRQIAVEDEKKAQLEMNIIIERQASCQQQEENRKQYDRIQSMTYEEI